MDGGLVGRPGLDVTNAIFEIGADRWMYVRMARSENNLNVSTNEEQANEQTIRWIYFC